MIKAFVVDNDRLRLTDDLLVNGDKVVWADLVNPTKEEEATIESWLSIAIPTREEMEEIEISSRLY
ncbi:MAG: magnesium transporter, partial [Mesorhizobium sp.]